MIGLAPVTGGDNAHTASVRHCCFRLPYCRFHAGPSAHQTRQPPHQRLLPTLVARQIRPNGPTLLITQPTSLPHGGRSVGCTKYICLPSHALPACIAWTYTSPASRPRSRWRSVPCSSQRSRSAFSPHRQRLTTRPRPARPLSRSGVFLLISRTSIRGCCSGKRRRSSRRRRSRPSPPFSLRHKTRRASRSTRPTYFRAA